MTENPKAIMWLDPGLTTGWATLYNIDTPDEYFDAGQVYGRVEAGDKIEEVLSFHGKHLHLGWEAYIVGHGSRLIGDPVPSLEVIGMARWLGHKYHATMLKPVPSEARLVAIQKVISHLGWSVKGIHATDATRHLIAYLIREKLVMNRIEEVYGGMLARYNRVTEAMMKDVTDDHQGTSPDQRDGDAE